MCFAEVNMGGSGSFNMDQVPCPPGGRCYPSGHKPEFVQQKAHCFYIYSKQLAGCTFLSEVG